VLFGKETELWRV